MGNLEYDLFIASISGAMGFFFVPEKKLIAASTLFLLAFISQRRGWIGP